MSIDLGTIWVCQCCMLVHANGECRDDGFGHDHEPLSLIGEGESVTMGLVDSEHAQSCARADRIEGCDCEHNTFSSARCEGCGSPLGGDRYALTLWDESQ